MRKGEKAPVAAIVPGTQRLDQAHRRGKIGWIRAPAVSPGAGADL